MDSTREDKAGLKEASCNPRLYKLMTELFCMKWNVERLSNRDLCSPELVSVLHFSLTAVLGCDIQLQGWNID